MLIVFSYRSGFEPYKLGNFYQIKGICYRNLILLLWRRCMQRRYNFYILGGMILYITGVTNLASSVEVISPPIITKASGE